MATIQSPGKRPSCSALEPGVTCWRLSNAVKGMEEGIKMRKREGGMKEIDEEGWRGVRKCMKVT